MCLLPKFETKKIMDRTELDCIYALSRIFMYEPRLAREIISRLGSASAIFKLSGQQLFEIMGPGSRFRDAILNCDPVIYGAELDGILGRGCRYLTYDSDTFPALLSECEDAPLGLFVQSADNDSAIFGRESVSVVGSRDMTPYGREWCQNIVRSLASSTARPTIVSGLAFGVDICSHLTALECGLPTIAVLGTGIFNIYPSRHTRIAERIAATPGCAVISEYPPFTDVSPVNFLSRNRIIAGLSRATILIESRIKGGGMTTARTAASYNRDVFALPGRNCDIMSQGCNYLLHSHIAAPIVGCDELFRSLDYTLAAAPSVSPDRRLEEFYTGSMDEGKIAVCKAMARAIRKSRGISMEEVAQACGVSSREANSILRRLENDGFINIDLLQCCSWNNTGKKP